METKTLEQMVTLLVIMCANASKDQRKTNRLDILESLMETLTFLIACQVEEKGRN